MVMGSSGKRDVVEEYMSRVCNAAPLTGWRQQQCSTLAATVDSEMSADDYNNRQELNATSVCRNFWSSFTADLKVRFLAEEAAKAAEEKKRREEESKAEAEG